ncbi:Endonuclease YncB, thermonuclease family [Candidatus Electrothrix aarhusensis]|uniref:Endonuclease YncB, thermonuclease family n=1 Tax=Candidatus Electrothrix aarhusensis TaxID=1859131 RepID=A0A444IXQ7_9BACT|nr:Endonuclease YncB, thermonuclease family [Candidatus Electrothrix aarhusensis]
MKKTGFISFLCRLLLGGPGWKGKVVKVMDGDTLQIKKGKELIKIRLYGVDCPEKKQRYGTEATTFATQLFLNKKVRVEAVHTDQYGRTVALVRAGRKMLNRELVREGYAWVYPAYCKRKPLCTELSTLEEKAKKKKKGLWQQKRPMAPWTWRKKSQK